MEKGELTPYWDITGQQIRIGDRIKFLHPAGHSFRHDAIWSATVVWRRCVFTINFDDIECHENPGSWNREHDWTSSWGAALQRGEYGNLYYGLTPLHNISKSFYIGGSDSQRYEKECALARSVGVPYEDVFINVQVIGL